MTKEELLAMVSAHFDKLQALGSIDSFYDYEKQFAGIWKDLGREVLEKSIGDVSEDRRKKKATDPPGRDQHQ